MKQNNKSTTNNNITQRKKKKEFIKKHTLMKKIEKKGITISYQTQQPNRKIYKCLNNLNNCLKMLNLLNEGYTKILKLFYNEKKQLYLREIAKKTKLNENSTYRFLNKLEKENILKSKKQGNLKLFSIKNNPYTHLIFEFFDIEKFEQLPHIRKTAIKTYLDQLPEQPIFAIIFGSTARNTYTKKYDTPKGRITHRDNPSTLFTDL